MSVNKTAKSTRESELETLQLLFQKLAERVKPGRYWEVKICAEDGRIVSALIMDKVKAPTITKQIAEAF